MGPEAVAATDGRVARGERTRAAIVQALLDLLVEGDPTPTTAQIAERAGVSVRSLFGHFADTEALYRDLAREQAVRVTPLVEALERTGTLPQRIDALVAQRAELFETIAPVRHAIGTRAGRSEALQARLGEVAMVLRDQVSHQFADELDVLDADGGRRLLDALDLLCSFEAWDRLRGVQGLGRPAAAESLRSTLTAVLAGAPSSG